MIDNTMHERHLVELDRIQNFLEELEFETNLVEKSEGLPVNSLLAVVGEDHNEMPRVVNFSFVITPIEMVENINILQILNLALTAIDSNNTVETLKIIQKINSLMVVGQYHLTEANEIIFKHILVHSNTALIEKECFLDLMTLYVHMQEVYTPIIEEVAKGVKTSSNALL